MKRERIRLHWAVAVVAFAAAAASAQQLPIPGTGSGGASGPSELDALVDSTSTTTRTEQPANAPPASWTAEIPATSMQVGSQDASVDESALGLAGLPPGATINSSFTTYSEIDIAGSTNGTYILAYDAYLSVYTLSGTVVKKTDPNTFWCGGASPLPICSVGGFAGDQRVRYDTGAGRWIVTALWVFGNNPSPTDVLAVSKTGDPTKGWYRYQFPACGAFDTWDGSDQPHTGFNNQWIAVTSACEAHNGVNGAGLAVFNKTRLYNGGTLTLNTNWFEFVDPYSGGPYSGVGGGNGTRDNPVSTYAATINNREYLTVSTINSAGHAVVIYSHVEGATNSPVFYSATETVTTSFLATGPVGVDAPGCTGCMKTFANGWIHSSNVWTFASGVPYILSTMVLGDPNHARSTQIISLAVNTQNGAATALQVAGGIAGSGPLAAEIAMPLVRSGSADQALIVYDHSRYDFYPGVKDISWNVDANTVSYVTVLRQGSFTPNNGDQNRWADFIDGIAPIPGTSSLVVAGTLAAPFDDPQRSTYWADVTP
ncbi:MAG TPA: hypothetical protein VOA87_18915 [Thermoanaerobaculia bacterium]|nr:hypothetical protein [Thermoanaerobaculia bacterium]